MPLWKEVKKSVNLLQFSVDTKVTGGLMKNGIFRSLTALILGLTLLQLQGCASLLNFGATGEDDPAEYDRGYSPNANEEDCDGGDCDTVVGASDDGEYRRMGRTPEEGGGRVKRAIKTRDVILGMTRQEVEDSWGAPAQRAVAGNGTGGHERWTYGSRYSLGNGRTVIFENGKVAGWRR